MGSKVCTPDCALPAGLRTETGFAASLCSWRQCRRHICLFKFRNKTPQKLFSSSLQAPGAPLTSGLVVALAMAWLWHPALPGRAAFPAASRCSLHFFHHRQTHSRSRGEGEEGRKQNGLSAPCVGPWPCTWSEGRLVLAEAGPGLGSAKGPGAVPGCRQDVSSSPGSAADLERTESEVGKSQKRTHFINSFFFSS